MELPQLAGYAHAAAHGLQFEGGPRSPKLTDSFDLVHHDDFRRLGSAHRGRWLPRHRDQRARASSSSATFIIGLTFTGSFRGDVWPYLYMEDVVYCFVKFGRIYILVNLVFMVAAQPPWHTTAPVEWTGVVIACMFCRAFLLGRCTPRAP